MSAGARRNKRGTGANEGEVDELVEAAEALVLLSLNTDTHIARGGSPLDGDLSRRFDALKSHSAGPAKPAAARPLPTIPKRSGVLAPSKEDNDLKAVLGNDLSARFAALRVASSSSPARLELGNSVDSTKQERELDEKAGDGEGDDVDDEGVSKKEVDKVIQWAMDEARLDPAPTSDDDEISVNTSDDSDEDYFDGQYVDSKGMTSREVKKKKLTFPFSIRK